jgi:hypothetical protein
VVRFNWSKHAMKKGMTTLTSYLDTSQITFPLPTKYSIMCETLKCGSNMIVIMLWTYCASKDFKNSIRGLIILITSSHILLCRKKISTSKGSKFQSC